MNKRLRLAVLTAGLLCVIALVGCSAAPDDQADKNASPPAPQIEPTQPIQPPDEQEPESLLDEITGANYQQWAPAPGYESRVAAKGPHGDEVQILLDPTAAEGLAGGGDRWPQDSVIAKDVYQDGELIQIAAMKKTAEGWYWGEWDAQGEQIAEGLAVEPCQGCHANGTDGTLGVVLR